MTTEDSHHTDPTQVATSSERLAAIERAHAEADGLIPTIASDGSVVVPRALIEDYLKAFAAIDKTDGQAAHAEADNLLHEFVNYVSDEIADAYTETEHGNDGGWD